MSNRSRRVKSYSRKSVRLEGYDYRKPGAYFVTICTYEMANLSGRISAGEIYLNSFGSIARDELLKIQFTYPDVEIFDDEFVIMPNHLHAILWITDVGATQRVALKPSSGLVSHSLGAIIGQYKSRVTKQINQERRTPGKSVWQRNYYDRIIRNEKELLIIKKYITENPVRWKEDHGEGMLRYR